MPSNSNELRVVTEQDVLGGLVILGSLPRRASDTAELDLKAYGIALDGVNAVDLATAIRGILQGSLGHPFFPVPPELRLRCNAAADARATELSKAAKRQPVLPPIAEPSPEAKARAVALMEKFRKGINVMRGAEAAPEAEAKGASEGITACGTA